MDEPLLSVEGLQKSYGPVHAIKNAELSVRAGEVVCLVGPNGSGKTTLIECVEGLRTPDTGRITLFGGQAGERRERAALVGVQLQEEGFPARIKVGEAVRLFAAIYSVDAPHAELITQLGLDELVNRPFDRLSGGQKRRTALALAFINEPKLAILDEPSSGLDPQGQEEIVSIIRERAAAGTGLLVTTHDMQIATDISDQVVVIRTGRTIAQGTPADLLARLPFDWCLAGPGLETATTQNDVVVVPDGHNRRIYGPADQLTQLMTQLPTSRRARVTLRHTDLSDVAFHIDAEEAVS